MTNVSTSMEADMAINRMAAPNGETPAPEMTVKVVSDSMIFSAEDPIWMLVMITNAQKIFLTKNVAVRGAISHGLHWERTESNVMQLVSPYFVDAYILESKVASSARIIFGAKALEKLDLPEGMLIAAIRRGDEVIMPKPVTEIKSGDRVMIFCLLSQIPNLENLLRSGKTGFWR